MLWLIDAWWHDSQWVDSVSLQCCVWSGNILPPYPNPRPHSKTRLIKVFRVTCWEMPGLSAVNLLLQKLFSGSRQTERINSCRRPAGWTPAPSRWWLDGGKTQRAQRRAHGSLVKKKKKTKQDDKHDHVSGQTVRGEPWFTNSHTSRGEKTAAGTVDWKQTEVHTVHQPQAEQPSEKKNSIFTPTHCTAGSRQRCSIARTCARGRRTYRSLSRGCRVSAAVWKMNMSPCEESKHAASEPWDFPRPSPPAGRYRGLLAILDGRASPVTRAGRWVFAVHTEHITSSGGGTASSVSSYKSEVLATGGP